jgi:hypothetical protein
MKTSRSIMTYGIPCLIITNVRGPVIDWFTRDCMTLEIITATLLVSLTVSVTGYSQHVTGWPVKPFATRIISVRVVFVCELALIANQPHYARYLAAGPLVTGSETLSRSSDFIAAR